ncbi:two-component system sensor histidine kinase DcuS [Geothrix limicola]|uniref:histidine kinase n=1 Tax=Geothrix limicola TaxID=2927978 RepID=A0ABQ5QFE7_9BACT|nr:DcuS/MalK family sensor histidine kinase [Geothrix limicola]GLH73377.1 two-component system sensor histidine kinase DcuS [Geothrix limicola]
MPRTRPVFQLRARINLLVCLILALVLLVTGLMVHWRMEQQTREALGEKAMLLSRLVSEAEVVREGLGGGRPTAQVQDYAEQVRLESGMDYVVVMDMQGLRLSHPNRSLIGARFAGGDDADVYRGRSYLSVAKGTLGVSLRAFTPVRVGDRQVGAVAVGILQSGVDRAVVSIRKRIALGGLIGFAAGILGAMYLAGRIKRILMGMEPQEISTLLQQRNAMLHSVREGIIGVNRELVITVVNEEALRLFALAGSHGALVGRNVEDVLPSSRLRAVVETGQAEYDQEGDILGLKILTNRVPVLVDGRISGAVATFRDKTEVNRLAEQLTGVRFYADALRAQTHEFMNKLHVILGLVKLEEYGRLKTFITDVAGRLDDEVGFVVQRIKDPVVAGFLLARFSTAREQNILMRLDEEAFLPPCPEDAASHDLVTVLGNLLENAVEAIGEGSRREILVSLRPEETFVHLSVTDSGPGLPEGLLDKAFTLGFSTKGENRGFGLWQAARTIETRGGRLVGENQEGGGARFTASLRLFPGGEP